jgi:hypothetical protein
VLADGVDDGDGTMLAKLRADQAHRGALPNFFKQLRERADMNELEVFAVPKSLAQVRRQGRMEGGEDDIHTVMLAFAAHA